MRGSHIYDVRLRFKEFWQGCSLRVAHVLNNLLVSIATESVVPIVYHLRRCRDIAIRSEKKRSVLRNKVYYY